MITRDHAAEVLLQLRVLVLVEFELDIQVVHLVLQDHEVGVDGGLVRLLKQVLMHAIYLVLHPLEVLL